MTTKPCTESVHYWTGKDSGAPCQCGAKQRCGACLVTGKRCRRARATDAKHGYCERHDATMSALMRFNAAVIEGMKGTKRKR